MGKSLTPACLDADSLRYYMESLNGYLYLCLQLNLKLLKVDLLARYGLISSPVAHLHHALPLRPASLNS